MPAFVELFDNTVIVHQRSPGLFDDGRKKADVIVVWFEKISGRTTHQRITPIRFTISFLLVLFHWFLLAAFTFGTG